MKSEEKQELGRYLRRRSEATALDGLAGKGLVTPPARRTLPSAKPLTIQGERLSAAILEERRDRL